MTEIKPLSAYNLSCITYTDMLVANSCSSPNCAQHHLWLALWTMLTLYKQYQISHTKAQTHGLGLSFT